ncbi:cytochrome c3 family protein [Candidatus Neomarinimicrobiota bacterium]
MKLLKLTITIFFTFGILFSEDSLPDDACVSCHLEVDEDLNSSVMSNMLNDIHIQVGLSCADCHGGNPSAFDDPDDAMWDNDSFIGKIDKQDQPKVCGSCHSKTVYMRNYSTSIRTDQVSQYWTSRHGILLKTGDTKVATCVSCHGVHGIYSKDDTRSSVYAVNIPNTCSNCHNNADYMAEYDIPTDQLEKYKRSVHGVSLLEKQDIYAPACNDCHGNHGAIPPDVTHISDICGSCHINNKNLFTDSFLNNIFAENDLHGCEACHGNHGVTIPTDEMLNWSDESMCLECHDVDDKEAKEMSLVFYQTIDSLKTQLETAENLMLLAETKGMEVSDMFIHLEDAHGILIQTRTNIHSFDIDHVNKTAESGFIAINEATIGANRALGEFNYRRKGLLVFSLIITFAIVALFLKLKLMQRNK